MKFEPKSAAEIEKAQAEFSLWPKGTYDFEVAEATDEESSKGNDMVKLKLWIYNEDGKKRTVFDYLMPQMEFKLRHACEAMGLLPQYESGDLQAADFQDQTGKCVIYIKKGSNGYQDQNAVADYVKPAVAASRPATRQAAGASPAERRGGGIGGVPATHRSSNADLNDEIPFAPPWQ